MENGFIFHDFRRRFGTNAIRAGVHEIVVMTIQEHTDGNDMNRRHDTVDESDLINAFDQSEGYIERIAHPVDQEGRGESNSAKNI